MENNERPLAEELLERAEELIESGELAEAQSVLDRIEEKSGRKYFVQSKLFAKKGWRKEARVQILYAINAEPDNLEYKEALEKADEILNKCLSDEDYLARAEELIGAGQPEWAQNNLNHVKEKSGKKYYLQSRIYKHRKWYNEQRKQLKKAVEAEPCNEEYKKELEELEEFRKTAEYKNWRKARNNEQMGEFFGEGCVECCCAGSCECCAQGICEGLGSC